jgi:hypothetical protein
MVVDQNQHLGVVTGISPSGMQQVIYYPNDANLPGSAAWIKAHAPPNSAPAQASGAWSAQQYLANPSAFWTSQFGIPWVGPAGSNPTVFVTGGDLVIVAGIILVAVVVMGVLL